MPSGASLAISDRIGSMLAQGDLVTASRLATQWLVENPQDPEALRAAAWVAQSQGNWRIALEHMGRACTSAPDNAVLHKQFASLLANCKEWERALNHFRISLEISPEDAHTWHLAGLALLHRGQAPQALCALRRARSLLPDNERIRSAFAEAIFAGGLPDEALCWWRSFAESYPRDLSIQLKLGELLSRNGHFKEALQHFLGLDAFDATSKAGVQLAIAQVQEDMGDHAQAMQAYQHALALRPEWPTALAGLIQLQSGTAKDKELQLARQLLKNPSLPDSDRALLNYALGKVHDARSEFEKAIGCWHEANGARRRQAGEPQAEATYERAERLMLRCKEWPFGCEACPPEDNEPQMIFIVGMPRSGTTLTEQIIATHPAAVGCGELPELPLLAQQLTSGLDLHLKPWEKPLNLDALMEAKRSYLKAATRNRSVASNVLVDKAPLNFFNLWLASLLFPSARIVWCRRDPRDVGVSIYGENFALDERLCSRLDGIAHYINIQEKLMAHWRRCLPLSFHEVHYESLVAHPERETRGILDFVGLEWNPGCLQFYKRSDGVQTPSRWQVRQPIYNRSIGRWRNYREHLAPLIEALDTKPTRSG